MINQIIRDKKGISLSIVLLVFIAVSLIALTLYSFLIYNSSLEKKIGLEVLLKEAYNEAEQIQFYIDKGYSLDEAVDFFDNAIITDRSSGQVGILKNYYEGTKEIIKIKYYFYA